MGVVVVLSSSSSMMTTQKPFCSGIGRNTATCMKFCNCQEQDCLTALQGIMAFDTVTPRSYGFTETYSGLASNDITLGTEGQCP